MVELSENIMKEYIVTDLDGTLCNCVHRLQFAQGGLWDEFHSRLGGDEVYEDTLSILGFLSPHYNIIALTGRNEKWRMMTERWLASKEIGCIEELLMRPDDDYRPDVEMKIDLLEKRFKNQRMILSQIKCVLEDRDKVVEGLRNYGLPVWQVRPGGY